ncbi:hypothetical protein BDZ91DRAFT_647494 [Kalaharituber pfeilii]|nr:hypothetical protein BDZ91DRAFT_647494 [Kalaharituber pfeilii]
MQHATARPLQQLRWAQVNRGFATTPLVFLNHSTPSAGRSMFLPRFLQPDTLKSFVPTFLRRSTPGAPQKKKEWNPYTFFIVSFLLTGSLAINHIGLKHEHQDFMRKAEARIDVLREVIDRVMRGEDVDVEKMLGTGNPADEKDWEDVLKEIEEEDLLWQARGAKKQSGPGGAEASNAVKQEESADKSATVDTAERKQQQMKKVPANDTTFL